MNHYDFMERKSRRRQLDILDYVKNTGKPKKYRGGGGRGGSRAGAGRPSSNMPQIDLYFNTGGREVLYNQTQPHPYNPQHLPVNIQNAQPNQQAVADYNAQQRIDTTDLRNQQAQMNQNIIQLRDRIQAQAMNPAPHPSVAAAAHFPFVHRFFSLPFTPPPLQSIGCRG